MSNAAKAPSSKVYGLDRRPSESTQAKARSAVRWVPVPEDAFQAALKLRAQVQKVIHMRPDVSMVIAAMLTQPVDAQAIAEAVARHGLAPYAKAGGGHDTPGSSG